MNPESDSRLAARLRFVPIALIGVLVFHLIRTHLCECYHVDSGSMEPTIHGEKAHGDRVLVDRTAWWFRDPKPWDTVVVHLEPDRQIVKRLVCLGEGAGTLVVIRGGDIFTGPDERTLKRLAKHPITHRDLRLTSFLFPSREASEYLHGARIDKGSITLAPAAPDVPELRALVGAPRQLERRTRKPAELFVDGHLATAQPVDLSYLDHADRRCAVGAGFDCDFGMELDLVPSAACRAVQLVFEYHDVYWSFCLAAERRGTLARQGEVLAEFEAPGLVPARSMSLAFGHLDGAFFLEVDGELLVHHAQELDETLPKPAFEGARMENLLHVGGAGGAVTITRMRVFRDLYYKNRPIVMRRSDEPFEVRAGELFLLGDNTFDSADSREHRFEKSQLIGRPLAVVGPFSRMHWITR